MKVNLKLSLEEKRELIQEMIDNNELIIFNNKTNVCYGSEDFGNNEYLATASNGSAVQIWLEG